MTKTGKIVKIIYLYVVSLISLIFLAVGIGNLVSTTLKAYIFTEAEKRDYQMCDRQPYFVSTVDTVALKESGLTTPEKQVQIDNMLKDYDNWKAENTGDTCIKSERQKRMVDSITMILIALPLYILHWRMARKEKQESDN